MNVTPLQKMVTGMYRNRTFCPARLSRKISPYIKTSRLGDIYSLRSRKTNKTVRLIYQPYGNEFLITVIYSSTYGENIRFEFFCNSNREFMQKLINHNLIS
jgi:hypothetical protein